MKEKTLEKNMYICISEPLCCALETNTHCKLTILQLKKKKKKCHLENLLKMATLDFPGGTVVKNPPANAGDMGLSPGLGRSHILWSN